MTKIRFIFILLISILFTNCKTDEREFLLGKRYWDLNDYDKVILELKYGYKDDEKLPSFNNPQTRAIVEKLTDQQNFNVVLNDNELGLKHKNNVAEKFFEQWQDMNGIYDALDRKDNYLYDEEMLAVWHFGLGLQLKYFKLGNDNILKDADDPNSKRVLYHFNSNVKTLVKNFQIYLDEVNKENAYSQQGKIHFARGIDKYFTELIAIYPKADYSAMKKKAELMLNKSNSEEIKASLNTLIELIASNKAKVSKE